MKANVAEFSLHGEKFRETAIAAYGLTDEELNTWVERYRTHGLDGLKTTQLQKVGGSRG